MLASLRLASPVLSRSLATSASNTTMKRVAFIGLGNMGGHMARNLLNKGIDLVVFDTQASVVDAFASAGAKTASSPKAASADVDAVITMLPSSPHVRQVVTGDKDSVIQSARPGTLLIDCSTIDPKTSREVAATATSAGLRMIDAPVSGGVRGAEGGTLTFMVGGLEADFELARPLLDRMGTSVFHCGAANGTGQVAKICNNMLLAIGMIGTAEAMNLGVKHGMDPALLAKIINVSSGRCWSSELYNPVPGVLPAAPASKDYAGGFGAALMAKDLGLARQAASDAQAATPLGELADKIYAKMLAEGMGGKDFSVVYKFLEQNKM